MMIIRAVGIRLLTRKSSCVNARGIPTAAYQVLHLLSYPGEGGTPSLAGEEGVPPILTWDQSLGSPPERTWDQWKYYGMEMGYPRERTWDQWKYYGMEVEMGYPPWV